MKKAKTWKLLPIALLCVALSLVLLVACSAPKYAVNFETNGGSAVEALTDVLEVAESPATSKTGHTFGGWYAAADLSGEAVAFPLTISADTTLYAKWTANKYTISFDYGDAQEGFGDDEKEVTFGTAIGELPSPVLDGHTFAGWYSGDAVYTAETVYNVADNLTLVAKFAAESYTLNFDYAIPEGQEENVTDNETETKIIAYGAAVGELPSPAIEGYNFLGWIDAEREQDYDAETVYFLLDDVTLTAKWEIITFRVVLDCNGGTTTHSGAGGDTSFYRNDVKYGETWSKTFGGIMQRGYLTGHGFTGWYTEKEGGEKVDPETIVFKDAVTYYAQYTPNTYTVTYNVNGMPVSLEPNRFVFGQPMGKLPEYTQEGYTFIGWKIGNSSIVIDKDDTTRVFDSFVLNNTFHAVFEANVYDVTLALNGGTLEDGAQTTLKATYNAALTLPTPTLQGKVFAGWYYDIDGENEAVVASGAKWNRASDATLTAKWVGAPRTLSFDYVGATGGNTETERTVNAEMAIGNLPTPQKTGHTFGGWFVGETEYTAASIMPDSDLILVAKWTANAYQITFNLSGGTFAEGTAEVIDVTYGEAIGTLPVPTKTDSIFEGWTVGGSTTLITAESFYLWAADQVLIANWSDDIYTKGINYVYIPAANGNEAYYRVGEGTTTGLFAYADDNLTEVLLAPEFDDGVNGTAPVKEIGDYAFYNKKNLLTVQIPASVTRIGAAAFQSAGLKSFTVPETVTDLGVMVFLNCASLTNLVIEGGINTPNAIVGSFSNGCYALREVTLPAFATWSTLPTSASALREVTITGDGEYYSVKGVVYQNTASGKSLVFIPSRYVDFAGSILTIEEGTVSINRDNNVSVFEEIIIPASLKNFNVSITGDNNLKKFTVDANNESYCTIDGVLYSKDKTNLIGVPSKFVGELNIPAETVSFTYALNDTNLSKITGLTAINLAAPTSAYKTENGILWKPDGTQILHIPNGYVGEVHLKKNTTRVPISRIYDGVTAFTVEEGNTAYKAIDGVLFSVRNKIMRVTLFPGTFSGTFTVPVDCASVGNYFPSGLTGFEVAEGHETLAAFGGVLYDVGQTMIEQVPTGFKGVLTLPSTISWVENFFFYEVPGITAFDIEAGSSVYKCVDGVLYSTADDGASWTLVAYPMGKKETEFDMNKVELNVTEIADTAFQNVTTLETIKVGSKVTTIGMYAFEEMTNLKALYLLTDEYVTANGDIATVNQFGATIYVADQAAIDEYTTNTARKLNTFVKFMEIAPAA